MRATSWDGAGRLLATLCVVLLAARGVRGQDTPPLAEVCSGAPLNARLAEAQALQALRIFPADVPLDARVVQAVNVTRGQGTGSLAMLRTGKGLRWPVALQAGVFEAARKRVETALPQAAKQAEAGKVPPATVEDLRTAVARLRQVLGEQINEYTPTEYIEAARFLARLDDTARALQAPDVHDYLIATREVRAAKTVAELVRYMADHRLQFAPATPGGEEAYQTLYGAVTDHSRGRGGARGAR
jgi:hypothetical protein